MTRVLLAGLCLTIATCALGQTDSLATDEFGPYSSLRIGIGIEKSPFVEIGLSRLTIFNKLGFGSMCFYGAGQVNITSTSGEDNLIYGGKAGFETSWALGMWGVETKYLTVGTTSQWYFTPKLGLSLAGATSLLYGLNIPKDGKLTDVGRHQISLTINFSRRMMKEAFR